mgnify:FL=1
MISEKVLRSLEFDKIEKICSEYAVLERSKRMLCEEAPADDAAQAEFLLKKTAEAFKLLYDYGVAGVDFFDELTDEPARAKRNSTLSMGDLLRVARMLRSSRYVYNSVTAITDEEITALRALAESLYCDKYLEDEIFGKILSDDRMSDNASEALAFIRRKIKRINEQVKERLAFYVRSQGKYLQDSIVTMRGNRYVIPVKSEFRGQVKGFIHDQSASGSTLFVEPMEVLELNNDLRTATLEEQAEVERILAELTAKTGLIASRLENNAEILCELDCAFAKAVYAYRTKATKPKLNANGYINIPKGRHPLIDPEKVVPVSLSLGSGYNYLLITGPNTGGKTVTLKLTGLFSVMAATGYFVQAADGVNISVFDRIFVDVGDEQSIEQNLSTFSSHMKNLIEITESVNDKSLVLVDEMGAGTDPDEGSALARAILERLVEKKSFGIVTTHYSALKEYAFTRDEVMNASMDFDEETFAPLYKLNIGMAGSSNAIKNALRLGLSPEIADKANSFLSERKVSFEKVISEAEKTRRAAEKQLEEYEVVTRESKAELDAILAERAKLEKEREKLYLNAKIESRRIVNESVEEAEDILNEIKSILDKDEIGGGALIRARTLRNKLEEQKYKLESEASVVPTDKPIDGERLKTGDRVYIPSMEADGVVVSVNRKKGICDVNLGDKRVILSFSALFMPRKKADKKKEPQVTVRIDRGNFTAPELQINVIGLNVDEALDKTMNFLDRAVLNNLPEVKIIHGVGMKKLSTAIHDMLRKHPHVESFRFGKYGEGEHGVTFVTLK